MDVHRRIIIGLASFAALYASSSLALGLGEVRLDSALHQPLDAIIELHGTEGLTTTDIVVSLADADAFSRVGIERPSFLTDLRFTPVLVNQQLAVRVVSNRPVNEPYLNFLVQLHRPGGLLLREYTLLLDPPLYQPTPVLAATTPEATTTEPAALRPTSQPTPAVIQPALPDLQPQAEAEHYQTTTGDSLWVIAQTTRPDESVPVRRQMLAIRALNPDAFANGDMNRLRIGQTLTLPTPIQVGARATPTSQNRTPDAVQQAETSLDQPTETPATPGGRLRIEEPELQAPAAENEQLHDRLGALEVRFNALLGELDARDRQIASLQAELEVLRRARDAELADQALATASEAAILGDASPAAGETTDSLNEPPVAGAIERQMPDMAQPEPAVEQTSLIGRWWVILLALLAVVIAAIVLRLRRRQPERVPPIMPHSAPQSISVPGTRAADPLEGVQLYITYGRFAEARNMLEKAITAEPRRVDLRLSQLAVLAELGDAAAFAEQETAVRELGSDSLRIEELKALYPQIDSVPRNDMGEPEQESTAVPFEDKADHERSTLDLDDFDVNADWNLIDELDKKSSKPSAAAFVEPDFESNLTDFPEVGELDQDFASHFDPSGKLPKDK